jgi:hypothetical protein
MVHSVSTPVVTSKRGLTSAVVFDLRTRCDTAKREKEKGMEEDDMAK